MHLNVRVSKGVHKVVDTLDTLLEIANHLIRLSEWQAHETGHHHLAFYRCISLVGFLLTFKQLDHLQLTGVAHIGQQLGALLQIQFAIAVLCQLLLTGRSG